MFGTINQVFVKLNVFRVNGYDKDDCPTYSSFVSTTISFQRNAIEPVEVNGYPFKIRMDYPTLDILYDNMSQDTLASLNIEEDDEISPTTLNKLGTMFSVEIKLDRYEEVDNTTDCKQEQVDFESTINYYDRYDLMYITMGHCPEDDYTLSDEVYCDDHLIYEDRTNNDDTLVGIKIFDFKSISIDKLKEQYNDCLYPYWDNLKNYQNTLKENPHESTN